VVRLSDILAHRLKHMHAAFSQAIAENDYKNRYAAVFPIKVNQQRWSSKRSIATARSSDSAWRPAPSPSCWR